MKKKLIENKYKSFAYVLKMAFVASLGSIYFGYQLGVVILAKKSVFSAFDVESSKQDYYSSLLNISVPFGAIFGSISTGLLLNYISRKNAFIFTDILGTLVAALSQIQQIDSFIIMRFISGIVTGLNSVLVPKYIQEVSPQEISNIIGVVHQISIGFGFILASANGQFFDENPSSFNNQYWRFVFIFPILFTISRMALLQIFFNYETPFYYIIKDEQEKMYLFLRQMYKPEYIYEIHVETQKEVRLLKEFPQGYFDMFNSSQRKRLFICCALQLFQQLSGLYMVFIYSEEIIEQSQLDYSLKNLLQLVSGFLFMISSIMSIFLIKRFGCRIILIYGSALTGAFLFGLTILALINNEELWSISFDYVLLYYFAFNLSLGPIIWIYCSSILPPKGLSIATMFNWLGALTSTLIFPHLSSEWVFFVTCTVVCITCSTFTIFFVYEIKGKTKLQISLLYLQENSLTKSNNDTTTTSSFSQ